MGNEMIKSGNTEILNYYLSSGLLQECINYQFLKLCKFDETKRQFKDDLFQDLCVWTLTYDNEKLNNAHMNKHDNALLTRVIQNQIYSKSSEFYTKYLKFMDKSNELTQVKDDIEDL